MTREGFFLRSVAWALDTALLVLYAVLCGKLSRIMYDGGHVARVADLAALGVCWLVLPLAPSLLEVSHGRSAGKLLIGARIADAAGNPPTLVQGLARWFLKHLPFLLILMALVFRDARGPGYGFWALNTPAEGRTYDELNEVFWFSGLAALLLQGLCCLRALGARRQTVYDAVTGTAVFTRRALCRQPLS